MALVKFEVGDIVRMRNSNSVRCRDVDFPKDDFGKVISIRDNGKFLYTIHDPLTGTTDYWLSHLCLAGLEAVVETVELPYDREFLVDAVQLWSQFSNFDIELVQVCFRRSLDHFIESDWMVVPADEFQVDSTFGFLSTDFSDAGLASLRRSYRDWILNSVKQGGPSQIGRW